MKKLLITLLMILMGTIGFAAEKLYIGTNAEYKPYEYLEDGKLVGFDIEFMEMIANKVGFEVVWQDMNFDGLIAAIQAKKIDGAIAGMAGTPERKKAVDFSIPYLKSGMASIDSVVVAGDSNLNSKESLKGKSIGVQLGTIQEQKAIDLGGELKTYSNNTAALMAVKQGKLDAVIVGKEQAEGFIKSMNGLKIAVNLGDEPPISAIALRKGNEELLEKINKAIVELQGTKEYDDLYNKHFKE